MNDTEQWNPEKDPFACSVCGTALFSLERAESPKDVCSECVNRCSPPETDRAHHVMSEEQHNDMAAERNRQLRRGTEPSEGGA